MRLSCILYGFFSFNFLHYLKSLLTFVGDGAGVGKGRTIACVIFENYLLGRKRSIWYNLFVLYLLVTLMSGVLIQSIS